LQSDIEQSELVNLAEILVISLFLIKVGQIYRWGVGQIAPYHKRNHSGFCGAELNVVCLGKI